MKIDKLISDIRRSFADRVVTDQDRKCAALCDAYETLQAKYRQVMDAARVNEDAPTVSGYDPSGDERTVSLRWPSGNLRCYDRTDMRTVDLMEAQIDELRAEVERLKGAK